MGINMFSYLISFSFQAAKDRLLKTLFITFISITFVINPRGGIRMDSPQF